MFAPSSAYNVNFNSFFTEKKHSNIWLCPAGKLSYEMITIFKAKGRPIKGILDLHKEGLFLGVPIRKYHSDFYKECDAVYILSSTYMNSIFKDLQKIKDQTRSSFQIITSFFDEELFETNHLKNIHIKFDMTNSCNLRCRYCYSRLPILRKHPHMPTLIYAEMMNIPVNELDTCDASELVKYETTIDEFTRMINNLGEIKSFSLSCGYEPLIHREFNKILQKADETKLPNLFLITNATLLTDDKIEAIIRYGVKTMAVSLDTHDDTLSKELRGVLASGTIAKIRKIKIKKDELRSPYPEIGISYTIFEDNKNHLPPLIERIKGLGVKHIWVSRLILRNLEYHQGKLLSDEEVEDIYKRVKPLCDENGIQLSFGYSNISRPERIKDVCMLPFTYRYISSEGEVFTCSKSRLGNIFKESHWAMTKKNKAEILKAAHMQVPYCKYCKI